MYPQAPCNAKGHPDSGTKSTWHEKINVRYDDTIINNTLPNGWVPNVVVVDGIFMLNSKPLRCTSTVLIMQASCFQGL